MDAQSENDDGSSLDRGIEIFFLLFSLALDLYNDISLYFYLFLIVIGAWVLFRYGGRKLERDLLLLVAVSWTKGRERIREILERCVLSPSAIDFS